MFNQWRTSRVGWLVVVVVAALAAGGGYAFAAASSTGVIHACSAKRGGALRVAKKCRKTERSVTWNVQGVPGKNGTNGADGTNGTNGTNGLDGTVRAYGLVTSTTVTRSKNITGVTSPSTGFFCIRLAASIDAATTGAVVTLDFYRDDTQTGDFATQAIAEWVSGAPDCPAGTLEVRTFKRQVSSSSGFVTDVSNTDANEGFFVVIP